MQKYLPCPSFLAYDIQSAVMDKVEALDLLEESWFFENLFDRRRRMLRCYSDPCTSPNFSHDVLAKDSCDQTGNGLVRAPSFPPCIGKEEKVRESKDNGGKIKLNTQLSVQISEMTCSDSKIHEIRSTDELSQRNLVRTPSLPSPRRTNELTQDNDSDLRMSKLIRQAMANSPDILPPRHSHNKAMNLQRSSLGHGGRHSNPKPMLRKSPNDLAFQELQGFKDLGFTFDDEDLSPDVVNILSGLQGTKIDELEQGKVRRKPYLSEAWLVQGPTPPLPACVTKNSAEDMKAQIRFWARAVATNVRHEC
ncbi:uncharacterized protein LOC120160609 [Hibiscus syriacus]|uniref:uncharacterized protein LOC120160609 n=1 Tax=Hibiscus syriacus TaxID=106335 RepID=UPI0019228D95|nr:uncharacterized protein LOC120160609 [Hibiscus syriacus]